MELGGSDKTRGDAGSTGGSYGFGKTVYIANSRVGMIFAFSRILGADNVQLNLLMGCAYHRGHEYEGRCFSGRAFMGIRKKVDEGIRFDPFQGEKAEKLARDLGFRRQSDSGTGTSILLVDTLIRPEEVVSGIENWWWPRIEERLLEATVIDSDDHETFPQPGQRPHLKPFITAFRCAIGKEPDIAGRQQRKPFKKSEDGKETGVLGAVTLDGGEDDSPLGEDFEDWLNSVALVRSTRMVVAYHRGGRHNTTLPPAAGCFVAAQDIDHMLKLSEPPTHDRWDPAAERLTRNGEQAPKTVQNVLKRIRENLGKFRNSVKPPAPARPERLIWLERQLNLWFGGGGPKVPPTPPEASSAPVSLRPSTPQLCLEGGKMCLTGHVDIEVPEDAGMPQVHFTVYLSLQVAEDDDRFSAEDQVPLTISSDGVLEQGEENCWHGTATPKNPVRIKYKSAPYDPGWTVRLVPDVRQRQVERQAKEGVS